MRDTINTGINPDNWYRARELARPIDVSPRLIQREVRRGRLKAAVVNARGDLRIKGEWALFWLEQRAARDKVA